MVNDHVVDCFRHAECRAASLTSVPGAVIIVLVLLLFPVLVIMSGARGVGA